MILAFGGLYPEITLEWREYPNDQVKEKLMNSEIEYGFVIGNWEEEAVQSRRVCGCQLCLLVYEGHPLYEEEQVSLGCLKGERLLLMNEDFRLYHDVTGMCAARGFVPDIAAKTADGAGLYRLCSQKVGLAVVPEFFRDEFRMEGVRAIPFEEHFLWEVYGVCRRETAGYENIRLFDRYLKEQAGL